MNRTRVFEIFLAEVIIYLVLWLSNDYLATFLSLIFFCICLLILIISIIVDWIDGSTVPRWYFMLMTASTLAPLLAALIFIAINGEIPGLKEG